MSSTRRDILKLLPVLGVAATSPLSAGTFAVGSTPENEPLPATITIQPEPRASLSPLSRIRVESSTPGRLIVRDGNQRVYYEIDFRKSAEVVVGGALGTHSISLVSVDGQLLGHRTFEVDCKTQVSDGGGAFNSLLGNLLWTMQTDGPVGAQRYKGEIFNYWVSWLQDNTNTLKGMKYFWPEVKSNVDFYANSQREDGMVFENFESCTPPETDWERRFNYGDFTRKAENGFLLLRRAPVENHVELFFLEAIYYSWKASGDTPWMAAKLDRAIRAVRYATTDPYRWSTKYQLLKRGFTIDTWDFLCDSEAALVGGDIMVVKLDVTHFGVFFGDNANMIAGLRRLAEMLDYVHRSNESGEFRTLADEMEKRLNALSWNGEFFVHWIPEDRDLKFDMGVDIDRQVALSNAYSLNRGISHQQCVAIIETYQRIRKEMPKTSPGEFYAIYPPFERGWGDESYKWEYMNGGVMSCTAGELAHGAFENGFEEYGVDILRRQKTIADQHQGFVPGILRGKVPEPPPRTFHKMDMRAIVNADFGAGGPGVPGWTSEPGNDLAAMPVGNQVFREVPFDVIDPASNGKRACLGISSAPGYKSKASLPVDATARSFYLLHAKGGDNLAGKLTVRYADGSSYFETIEEGKNISHWWAPTDSEWDLRYGPGRPETMQVAWRGGNKKFGNVGVYVVGFENRHPEKTIASLQFESMDTSAKWMVLAVTLSNAPVFLPPWTDVSTGMPNNWGAAALVFALLEGLCGVKDTGVAFDRAGLAPRWIAAGTNHAQVSVRYPASRGYVSYKYVYHPETKKISLEFTGSAQEMDLRILLPEGTTVKRALMDEKEVKFQPAIVRSSHYAQIKTAVNGAHSLSLELV